MRLHHQFVFRVIHHFLGCADIRHESSVLYLTRKFRSRTTLPSNYDDCNGVGDILISQFFTSLLIQTIKNPHLSTLIEYIIIKSARKYHHAAPHHHRTYHHTDDTSNPNTEPSGRSEENIPIFGRISCPKHYIGMTYGHLFEDILEVSSGICIGVHRLKCNSVPSSHAGK